LVNKAKIFGQSVDIFHELVTASYLRTMFVMSRSHWRRSRSRQSRHRLFVARTGDKK